MVEAQAIEQFQLALEPLHPPGKAAQPVPEPGVHRRAPELARFGEVIGRHAALGAQGAERTQRKQAAMAPDIGAVMGHIEGQIAEDLHPQAAGQRQQPQPLDLQLPLEQGLLQQGVLLVPVECGQGPALAAGQGFGPLPPGRLAVEPAQHHEAAMVLQPELLLEGPGVKAAALVFVLVRPALQQLAGQELGALGRRRQVEAGAGARRQVVEVARLQQAVLD